MAHFSIQQEASRFKIIKLFYKNSDANKRQVENMQLQ